MGSCRSSTDIAQSEFRVCASSEGKSVKKSNRSHKTSRDLEGAEGGVGASRLDVDVGRVSVGSSSGSRSTGVDSYASHGGRPGAKRKMGDQGQFRISSLSQGDGRTHAWVESIEELLVLYPTVNLPD